MSELILVIEDEKEIQDLIRYNLEKAGYRVTVAKDGDRGLEQLFASRPDAFSTSCSPAPPGSTS